MEEIEARSIYWDQIVMKRDFEFSIENVTWSFEIFIFVTFFAKNTTQNFPLFQKKLFRVKWG